MFQGIVKERCGSFEYDALTSDAGLSASLVGGGVFTLEGEVAALIADCAGRPIAVAATTVADVLAHRLSQSDVLEQSYGFRLAEEPPGLVIAVWADSPAAAAGLQPGDIVTLGSDLPSTARRGRRTVRLDWSAVAPPTVVRGITFEGNVVRAVAPGSPAAAAGVAPGDAIVEPADAARAIERANGLVVVTLERDGRRRRTLIQP
jgi:S1-C subfamily serine protease